MPRDGFAIFIASLAYTMLFGVYFLVSGNSEFFWYVLLLLVIIATIYRTLPLTRFTPAMQLALSFWGLFHMMGGGLQINGEPLYRLVILPLFLDGEMSFFRFDQWVHFYGSVVGTIAVFFLLTSGANSSRRGRRTLFVTCLAGLGIGAFNETVEFIAFIYLPYTTVGDYTNTGLDLIFNAIGVITAISLLYFRDYSADRLELEANNTARFD